MNTKTQSFKAKMQNFANSIRKIIENSPFKGFRIKLNGLYEKIIIIPFVTGFSACDIITPSPIKML